MGAPGASCPGHTLDRRREETCDGKETSASWSWNLGARIRGSPWSSVERGHARVCLPSSEPFLLWHKPVGGNSEEMLSPFVD